MLKYNPNLKPIARTLRSSMTDAERSLWNKLRGKQVLGVQFYPQKPIGDYIVDFYTPRAKLVIEVDGSQHLESTQIQDDLARTAYLEGLDLKVLRFNNLQVLNEIDAVTQIIFQCVAERTDGRKSP